MLSNPFYKRTEKVDVIYQRHVGDYKLVKSAFVELVDWCTKNRISVVPTTMAVFHDEPLDYGANLLWSKSKSGNCRFWTCARIDESLPANPKIKHLTMESVDVVAVDYSGAQAKLDRSAAWKKLREFVNQKGLTVSGPVREIIHESSLKRYPAAEVTIETQVPACALPPFP